MLGKMAQKPEVKFDKLFPKLYNVELWLMAYEQLAPKPGNMTPGSDGKTIDGMGLERITGTVSQLKASRYKPNPVRRVFIEKANKKLRPIGIPCFADKLLQTVIRLIFEAIYEPTFSETSHGFRPKRSCHTALETVKRMTGVRWWVEGDIESFFDNLDHATLLKILSKRITDKRFLHLIKQLLEAGYIEDWQYHKTYSGVPQGGNLSPLLSNIYLNELDQMMASRIRDFNRGKKRRKRAEYCRICNRRAYAKKKAKRTGNWTTLKALTQQMLKTPATDPQDPNFRRMYYVRYGDDFLIGISGSKADAKAIKEWLATYLKTELHLTLSSSKTLITHVDERARFLGYDIKRWPRGRIRKTRTMHGTVTRRTATQHLALLMPRDKWRAFCKQYGNPKDWQGESRTKLYNLSELEILMTYNTEIRGYLEYYALANNLTSIASSILWMTTTSFLKTLADKRKSTLKKVARSLKQSANRYAMTLEKRNSTLREYVLISSTKQLKRKTVTYAKIDHIPSTWQYRSRSELGQRLRAHQCEWCETRNGPIEVHHVRKLSNLKNKTTWERQMIERRRKTMVLCKKCHTDLHAGRLSEKTKCQGKIGEPCTRKAGTRGSEGSSVKPGLVTG
jgi:group II intron reverse transcriptase/maturase